MKRIKIKRTLRRGILIAAVGALVIGNLLGSVLYMQADFMPYAHRPLRPLMPEIGAFKSLKSKGLPLGAVQVGNAECGTLYFNPNLKADPLDQQAAVTCVEEK